MRMRSLMVIVAALLAWPVQAAGPIGNGARSPGLQAPRADAPALAVLPPVGPILPGAEGAVDAGGTGSILASAIYGGLVGAVIGLGVALLEGNNYGRDIGIGAGAGVLVGAALGAAHVFADARPLAAGDGLGTTDRDPVLQGRTLQLGVRF